MFVEQKNIKSRGVDIPLIVYYLLLVVIGWFTVFSSSYNPSVGVELINLNNAYARQLLFIGTSIILATAILLLDSRIFINYSYHIYLVCLVLMVLVIFFGVEISGARAWIKVGNFSIQPTEFAKFGTALALAKFFSEGKTTAERQNIWVRAFLFIFIPVLIIILQKDAGSALVFMSFIILFYREGLTGWILLLGALAVALFIFTLYFNEIYAIALVTVVFLIFWFINKKEKKKLIRNTVIYVLSVGFVFAVNLAYNHLFQLHQKTRIDILLGKVTDPQGDGFNANQSIIAIGSGDVFGKGYLHGTQTKLNFVPEQSTDFIFCGIGEEWGFFGSLVICGLFCALTLRILFIAERQRNPYIRCYGYGIAGIIFMHFFINIGMTIGVLPIIGIPLPLISYGGSSLWTFTTMLFVFIKMSDNRIA